MGFITEATPGAFEFRIADANGPIAGNSNQGHEGPRCTQTYDQNKWRDFHEEERYALVEYMKALGTPQAAGSNPEPRPNPSRSRNPRRPPSKSFPRMKRNRSRVSSHRRFNSSRIAIPAKSRCFAVCTRKITGAWRRSSR